MQVTTKGGSSRKETNGAQGLPKKFPCDKCEKSFAWKGDLNRHMQYHTGKFNHYCDTCRQGFAHFGHYRDHMDRHEAVRYMCTICSKSFALKRVYQSHLSVHVGEYKFKCGVCGEGFNVKSLYQKHIQCHL